MAGGQFGGGVGTAIAPYLIEDAADLNQIRNMPDQYYKLVSNINLGAPPYNFNKGWSPIDNFTGGFDGNGKKIYNLYIKRPDEDNVGLFRTMVPPSLEHVIKMRIHDVGFENVDVTGRDQVGAIIGTYTTGDLRGNLTTREYNLFTNVYVQGTVKGRSNVGGFCGLFFWEALHYTYQWNAAEDCMADVTIVPLPGGAKYGQMFGLIRDHWSSAYNIFYLNKCVGKCSLDTTFAPGANIGALAWHTSDNAMRAETSRYDKTLWPYNQLAPNANSSIGLTTAEMKDETKFSHLTKTNGNNGWSLAPNRYPELWHQSPDYLFVAGDGGYYTWDVTTSKWVVQSTIVPTKQLAIDKGMRHLEYIPQAAWDFFKNHADPNVVNVMDKADTISIYFTLFNLAKDIANSNNDKTIYRKEVTFNSFGGTLSTINI